MRGLTSTCTTIIESKVPGDMVKSGMYYYARSEEDIKELMKEWNILYWNETAKMRWAFSDIEHYFMTSCGQKRKLPARILRPAGYAPRKRGASPIRFPFF